MHSGVPGECDLRRRGRARRPEDLHRAQRRARERLADHHRRQAPSRGRRRVEGRPGQAREARALMLKLAFGLSFAELYERDGLVKVDEAFLSLLNRADAALAARLRTARSAPEALDQKAESA